MDNEGASHTIHVAPRRSRVGEAVQLKRVLIVDDEAIRREVLEHILNRSGYSAISASNGQEALEKLIENEVRCVVTGVHMPGMSGLDLDRKIRLLGSRLPVVFMSGTPAVRERLRDICRARFL